METIFLFALVVLTLIYGALILIIAPVHLLEWLESKSSAKVAHPALQNSEPEWGSPQSPIRENDI